MYIYIAHRVVSQNKGTIIGSPQKGTLNLGKLLYIGLVSMETTMWGEVVIASSDQKLHKFKENSGLMVKSNISRFRV